MFVVKLSCGASHTTPWHVQAGAYLFIEEIVHLPALSQPPATSVTLFALLRMRLVVKDHCGHGVQP